MKELAESRWMVFPPTAYILLKRLGQIKILFSYQCMVAVDCQMECNYIELAERAVTGIAL